jgi:DNA polymerase-4
MSRSQLRRPRSAMASVGDDTDCTILHVDMDAFYASVSLLAHPELVGQPVIIGGAANRGVVLSATYEARQLGIHSAMPMARARRLAPNAVVLPPDFRRYSEASQGVMALFRSITPLVEPLSLDEAFLDVAGSRRRLGRPRQIAQHIRDRVYDEQGITCSVGVAASKFVAKLASTLSKPDGMRIVAPEHVVEFLHPLPIGSLWGVGEKTEEALSRLGLRTVGDIATTPVGTLQRIVGQAAGNHMAELAWGRDPRRVEAHQPDRSIGAEETFGADVDDPDVVIREILRLSYKVAARMRTAGYLGRTVQLKVRFADFTTITRSRTLPDYTDTGHRLYTTASSLFEGLGLQRARLRLVGVRATGLADAGSAPQQLLLERLEPAWRDVESAVDRLSARFGDQAVRPARLVRPPDEPSSTGAAG